MRGLLVRSHNEIQQLAKPREERHTVEKGRSGSCQAQVTDLTSHVMKIEALLRTCKSKTGVLGRTKDTGHAGT